MCHTDYLRKAISCNRLIMKGNEGKRRFPERKKVGTSLLNPKRTNIFTKIDFWKVGSREPGPL